MIYYSIFKNSLLFDDDTVIPSVVLSSVNNDGDVALFEGYNTYDNPLWDVEKEGDVCMPIATSSLSDPTLNNMLEILESTSDLICEDTLYKVVLRDIFLYNLFAYDYAHACGEGTLLCW